MSSEKEYWLQVDAAGRLDLPAEVKEEFNLQPGAQVHLRAGKEGFRLLRPVTQLAKLYIEPTSRCNLNCRTCIRNAWDEPQGDMSAGTWKRVVGSLEALPSRPDIFFGGFGEPLAHSGVLDMLAEARPLARSLEMITNGMLLDEAVTRRLISLDLDVVWISIDGATAEHLAEVRLGAAMKQIFANVERLAILRHETNRRPEIGISFVAMRRNIADLPALLRMGPRLGASRFMVTNVLPYTEEMCAQMLYSHALDGVDSIASPFTPHLDLPRIDLNDTSQEAIFQALKYRRNVRLNGVSLGQERGSCPFIERGAAAIAWNGEVSPCLALMHNYQTFLHNRPRAVQRHVVGNINTQDLHSIWEQSDYLDFRKRVESFDFSPCTWCGGCSWSEANQEDCFANPFPTCGGCLWAQGVIKCP